MEESVFGITDHVQYSVMISQLSQEDTLKKICLALFVSVFSPSN